VTQDSGHVGARIRTIRQQRGLTQAGLAESDLSESYISLIESGKRVPGARTLKVIAARLAVTVDDLTSRALPPDPQISFALAFVELAVMNGDVADARKAITAIQADTRLDDRSALRLVAAEARLAEQEGDLETAISLLERFVADQNTDVAVWADAATSLVRCHRERGNLSEAVEVGERFTAQLVTAGLSGTAQHVAVGLTLASAYHERGDVVRAARLVEHLVAESERVGSREACGMAYWNAALIARGEGRQLDAVKLAERAVTLVAEGDDKRRLARLTAAQAGILLSLDEPQILKAIELLTRSFAQMEECGSTVDRASIATELGRAQILVGHADDATLWGQRSLDLLGDEPRLETAGSWMILARAHALRGESADAKRTARLAASMLEAMGASRHAAQTWRDIGDLMSGHGEHADACLAFDRALESMGVAKDVIVSPPQELTSAASFKVAQLTHTR
jgi:transcriptional regulator with XRE-family HTH domain